MQSYDVAIIGSGFAGTILGTILAKHNIKTVVIDRSCHPRFAIGEATLRTTTYLMRLLAERYDVPEFNEITKQTFQHHVHGIKKGFGYVYHRQDQQQDPGETMQVEFREYEHHYYRQDLDSYLLHTAIKYGATILQNTPLEDIFFHEDSVTLRTNRDNIHVKYVVDGSGYHSLIGKKYNLMMNPCPAKTNTRTIFNHMIDVKSWDDLSTSHKVIPWNQVTLHHLFDGGWIWIIPFNNRKDSSNELVSIGLTIDNRRFPKQPDLGGEEEFFNIISRYPSILKQFENARAVRDWVSTPRQQYMTKTSIGDRYCLLSHASGFIDALFSKGLANSASVINSLADKIINAVRDDDFSTARFEPVDKMQKDMVSHNDNLVHYAYTAFSDFRLWQSYFYFWLIDGTIGLERIKKARILMSNGNDSMAREVTWMTDVPGYMDYAATVFGILDSVERQEVSAEEAARVIIELVKRQNIAPIIFNYVLDKEERFVSVQPNFLRDLRTHLYKKISGNQAIKQYFDYWPMHKIS